MSEHDPSPALTHLFYAPDMDVPNQYVAVQHMTRYDLSAARAVMVSLAAGYRVGAEQYSFCSGFGMVLMALEQALCSRGEALPRLAGDDDSKHFLEGLVERLRDQTYRDAVHRQLVDLEMPLLQVLARARGIDSDPYLRSFEHGVVAGYVIYSEAAANRELNPVMWADPQSS